MYSVLFLGCWPITIDRLIIKTDERLQQFRVWFQLFRFFKLFFRFFWKKKFLEKFIAWKNLHWKWSKLKKWKWGKLNMYPVDSWTYTQSTYLNRNNGFLVCVSIIACLKIATQYWQRVKDYGVETRWWIIIIIGIH